MVVAFLGDEMLGKWLKQTNWMHIWKTNHLGLHIISSFRYIIIILEDTVTSLGVIFVYTKEKHFLVGGDVFFTSLCSEFSKHTSETKPTHVHSNTPTAFFLAAAPVNGPAFPFHRVSWTVSHQLRFPSVKRFKDQILHTSEPESLPDVLLWSAWLRWGQTRRLTNIHAGNHSESVSLCGSFSTRLAAVHISF